MTAIDPYDEVPYPSAPFPASHPSHLAMLGRLFNIETAPVPNCRVLELGCASGGNLIPLAQDLPAAQFVGVDRSSRQISSAQETIEQLGLQNIAVYPRNILDVDRDFGEFDYIICHGVFSWVPRQVQNKILHIGRTHLHAHGLMYVSYNTYPGWHMRGAVRDMMNYHVARFSGAQYKIDQARELLALLVRASQPQRPAYANLLKQEADLLGQQGDAYLYHEHLEAVNDPLYFHEFVERADKAELLYLGDVEVPTMFVNQFDEATARILSGASFLEQEQYMDFLRGRMFRSSVLCHRAQHPDRTIDVERLRPMFVRLAEAMTRETVSGVGEQRFAGASFHVATGSQSVQRLLEQLCAAFPEWLPVERLVSTDGDLSMHTQSLRDLMELVGRGVLLAAVDPPSLTTRSSERPEATPFCRLQASQGTSAITTRLHTSAAVDDMDRFILQRLDGRHTLAELNAEIQGAFDRREFDLSIHHTTSADATAPHNTLLDERLQYFASSALLIG